MFIEHCIIYLITFITTYYFAYFNIYRIPNLLILGWSLFGINTIGHEIYHLKRSTINNIFGFLFMDLWAASRKNWIEKHNKFHHYNLGENGEDEHLIEGSHIKNIINSFFVVVNNNQLLERSFKNFIFIFFRIIFFSQISWYAFFIVYFVNLLCISYFTLLAHTCQVVIENESFVLKQLHRTIDIFPQSYIYTLITGAFNLHTSHHLCPSVNRDGLHNIRITYKKVYPKDYREINTLTELKNLYLNRGKIFTSVDDWNFIIKSKKFIL